MALASELESFRRAGRHDGSRHAQCADCRRLDHAAVRPRGVLSADGDAGGRQCLDRHLPASSRVAFVLAFFLVFWLRGRSQTQKGALTMRILITGAAGMVGRKLIARLAKDGTLAAARSPRSTCTTSCRRRRRRMDGVSVAIHTGDLADAGARRELVASRPDVDLPSRRHRLGRGGGQFRSRLPRQSRRHAGAVRCRPAGGLRAARRLHLVDRGVRRAVPGCHTRRIPSDAADLLRHAEADGRGAAGRLFQARLLRRHRHPAADHLRAAGQAEQGGLGLLLRHHPRAAEPARRRSCRCRARSCTPMPARARR